MADNRLYGSFQTFTPKVESIDNLFDRFEEYCELNEALMGADPPPAAGAAAVEGPKAKFKKLFFLNEALPVDVKVTLGNLCQGPPKLKTFAELKTLLTDHFKPPELDYFEERKFDKLVQLPTENITDFSLRLQAAARKCNYDAVQMNKKLKNQLVYGVRIEKIRDVIYPLRKDDTVNFETTRKAACEKEEELGLKLQMTEDRQATVNKLVASRGKYKKQLMSPPAAQSQSRGRGSGRGDSSGYQSQPLQSGRGRSISRGSSSSRGRVNSRARGSSRGRGGYNQKKSMCPHCGRDYCDPAQCWARQAECYNCGNKGHISYMCGRVNYVQDEEYEQEEQEDNLEEQEEESETSGGVVQHLDATLPEQLLKAVYIKKMNVVESDLFGSLPTTEYGSCAQDYLKGLDEDIMNFLQEEEVSELQEETSESEVIPEEISESEVIPEEKVKVDEIPEEKELSVVVLEKKFSDHGLSDGDVVLESKFSQEPVETDIHKLHTEYLHVNAVKNVSEPLIIKVSANGQLLPMEIDTGSGVSLMNEEMYRQRFPNSVVHVSALALKTVDGSSLSVCGSGFVEVKRPQNKLNCLSIVLCQTSNKFTPLMGRDWLDVLTPKWRELFAFAVDEFSSTNENVSNRVCLITIPEDIQQLMSKFPADMLSRLPMCTSIVESVNAVVIDFNNLPLHFSIVAEETSKCIVLQEVITNVEKGWPIKPPSNSEILPFFHIRVGLHVESNCLIYGDKVIIPKSLQERVLSLLHEGHPGPLRMKMRARLNLYWPGLDNKINELCQSCTPCKLVNFRPCTSQTSHWPKTEHNWERLHLDFFYFRTVTFFLLIDVHSKWISVWPVPSTSAEAVIANLRSEFSIFGLPVQMVSDNGPPFDSFDFLQFCTDNHIIATKSPPYHPQSNGSAERAVKVVKDALNKLVSDKTEVPLSVKLVNFLFHYRNTPSTVTGVSPASLMLRHTPRTLLSMLIPPSNNKKPSPRMPVFSPGERVMVKRFKKENAVEGIVVKALGEGIYIVNVKNEVMFCHVNQMMFDLSTPLTEIATGDCAARLANDVPSTPAQNVPNCVNTPKLSSPLPNKDNSQSLSGVRCSSRQTKGVKPNRLNL